MAFGDYIQLQRENTRKLADVTIDTGTQNYGDVLTPKSANHQLVIQKITLSITTHSAGKVITFDDDGTGPAIAAHTDAAAAAGVPSVVVWDFGPNGRPLTVGANLDIGQSAAGVGGVAHIEAYERLGAVVAIASTN
jgi:hypothetical protein